MQKRYLVPEKSDKLSNADYTYGVLRQNILNLNLRPGEVINEKDFADLLNESRTPVHEAIARLESEGLCSIVPRKESRVSKISLSLVNEGLFLRCCIEPAIIASVSGNLSNDDIAAFRQNLDLQKGVINNAKDKDRVLFFQYDDEFHKLIYYSANKRNTYRFVNSMCGHLDRVRYLIRLLADIDLETSSYQHHCDLFQMLCFGVHDKESMESDYKKHISAFSYKLPMIMEQHPDYFAD